MTDKEKIQHYLGRADKSFTWLFTGDSITHGALHTNGCRSFVEHFAERIRWELSRPRDIVINTAISGNYVNDILDDYPWRVARFMPDVVFIMMGTNDSQNGQAGVLPYETNVLKLIDLIRRDGGIPVINTPNPVVMEAGAGILRTSLPDYVDAMRRISEEHSVLLIDHWSYWQKRKPDNDSMMAWLNDSIHPNEYGHRAFANQLFKALNIFDAGSPTCRLFTP